MARHVAGLDLDLVEHMLYRQGPLLATTCQYFRYTGWIFENGDDEIDIARTLLAAAKGKHIKVVDLILRMDDDAFQHGTRKSVLHVKLNGMETWKIAVQEGLSCIFEVWAN